MGLSSDIVAYVEEAVRRSKTLQPKVRLLVAVSGGQDSCALLLVLRELRDSMGLTLVVGHVDHGLRGEESAADARFVRELAERLDVPCRLAQLEMGAGASEEAARKRRFMALRQIVVSEGLEQIALGHTATDRAETVLMNILRGTGLDGLAAMPATSGDLIRPLLLVTRAETAAYCAAKGIKPRRDSTNEDESLLRNRVRLSLLPLLEREYRLGVTEALGRLAEIAEDELAWTQPLVREALKDAQRKGGDPLTVDLGKLSRMPRGLQRRVLREPVAKVRGGLQDFGLEHLEALSVLIMEGRTGQQANLPGLWAQRNADSLVLHRIRPCALPFEICLTVPGHAWVEAAGMELSAKEVDVEQCDPSVRGPFRVHLDATITGRQLIIRSPRAGDRIAPLGMQGTKKLHDFFVDKKIPCVERESIPVVETTQGEIVWVVGQQISERAKVTATTRRVIELVARPLT
ncbi:MAG: tRNA lysidine(34) synthetase TilS [Candidatus Zipacnadales bacterium]